MVSISPTAARSVVGTSWIAASGSPAAPQPRHQPGMDRLRRAQALRAAAQDRRVPGLQAQRAGVGGHVRPALEDHPHHPERRPHPADAQPRGPVPLRHHRADRIRLRRRSPAAPRPCPRPAPRSAPAGRAWRPTAPSPAPPPCRPRWPRGAPPAPPRSRPPPPGAPRPSAPKARRRAPPPPPAPSRPSPASAPSRRAAASIAFPLRAPGRRGAPAPPAPGGRGAPRSGPTGAP